MDKNCTKKHIPLLNCFKYQGLSKYLGLVKCCVIVAVYSFTSAKIEGFNGFIVIIFTRRYREMGDEAFERCLFKISVPVIPQCFFLLEVVVTLLRAVCQSI